MSKKPAMMTATRKASRSEQMAGELQRFADLGVVFGQEPPTSWNRCREAFVALIKKENFERDPHCRWSLKQHWTGAAAGFADEALQRRWHDFSAGWAALSQQPFDRALFSELQRHG